MTNKPDIYLLTIESLRADKVGAKLTPNINELASKSMVFNNFYCAGAPTPLSLKAIIGGIYPFEYVSRIGLDNRIPTLPEMLKQANYITCTRRLMGWYSKIYGFSRGFDVWEEYKHSRLITLKTLLRYIIARKVNITELNDISNYLVNSPNQEKPIFYWYHLERTHQPYRPDYDEFREISGGGLIRYFNELLNDERCWYKYRKRNLSTKNYISCYSALYRNIVSLETLYEAQIKSTDKYLGRFFSDLHEISSIRNRDCVIIVTSDHGEEFLERGSVAHSDNTHDDSVAKIPLIIYESWNKRFKSRDDLLNNLYIPHKILSYAQIDAPKEWNVPYLVENGNRYIIQEGAARRSPFDLNKLTPSTKAERYIKIRSNAFAFTKYLNIGQSVIETKNANEKIPFTDLLKIIDDHRRRQESNALLKKIDVLKIM